MKVKELRKISGCYITITTFNDGIFEVHDIYPEDTESEWDEKEISSCLGKADGSIKVNLILED